MLVGRFAPTPSGPLHFGSLVAALGSYCQARSQKGQWLIRMDDLDSERTTRENAREILCTLEKFGLSWDKKEIYQSERLNLYREHVAAIPSTINVYPCGCSRQQIKKRSLKKDYETFYDGFCRDIQVTDQKVRNYRIRLSNACRASIHDENMGAISEDLSDSSGDFVLYKRNGIPSYHLASVLDDHHMGITNVVRGLDLLRSSIRQAKLQELLEYKTPTYLHLPIAKNKLGQKLSKQNKAEAIDDKLATHTLIRALGFLNQPNPENLKYGTREEIIDWAVQNWNPNDIKV